MKRTTQSKDEDSEDEIWNYKSTRHGPTQSKKFKKTLTRGHKLSERDVAHSPVNVPVVNQSVYCPAVDRNELKRKTVGPKEVGHSLQNTKCDLQNVGTLTASDVTNLTLKSYCNNSPESLNFGSTPPRMSTGHCPSCQVPFSALITDSPGWHAMQCLEVSYNTPRPECSVGASCTNTILSHYQKYSHNLLALLRAGLDTGDSIVILDTNARLSMKSSEVCSQRSDATCSKRLNFSGNSNDASDYPNPTEQLRQRTELNGILLDCGQQDDFQNMFSKSQSLTYVTNSTPESKRNFDDRNDDQKSVQSEHFVLRELEASELCSTAESSVREENFKAEEDGHKVCSDSQPGTGRNSQSNDSQLDMFCDLSDVLNDVFGDETLILTQPASSRFSVMDASSNKPNVQTSADPSSLKIMPYIDSVAKPSAVKDLKSSAPCPRLVHKETQSSRPVCSPGKQTAHVKQMKKSLINNVQQLSINMFFKKVNGVSESSLVPNDVLIQMKGQKVAQDLKPCTVLSNKLASGSYKQPAAAVDRTVFGKIGQSEVKVEYGTSSIAKSEKVDTCFNGKAVINNNATVLSYPDRPSRKCPFYKRIPNTSICVDAFSYGTIPGCKAYFLSHFHYDHYCGLTKNFAHPIYCSRVTANLVLLKIRVKEHLVHALSLNEPQIIEGVEVTLLEANHCPGSVMFLFKVQNGQVFLHTGDFRADPSMEEFPQLQSIHVSQLFLDTTYCDPTYDFPCQKDVVQFAVNKTLDFMCRNPKMLIAVGTYSIGKERIFLALAEALDCEIFANRDKKNILSCLEDKSLNKRMTLTAAKARLHVLKMNQINLTDLSMYLESLKSVFDYVLAFEPTGWTHSKKTLSLDNLRPKASSRNITIYAVPYSEHSSYSEMKRFVQFLQPEKIIPTVNNGNPASRKKMEELFRAWHLSPTVQTVKTKNHQIQLNRWLENV